MAAKTTAEKPAAKGKSAKSTATKADAKKSAPAGTAAAKPAPAKRTTAKASTSKAATARGATAKTTAAKRSTSKAPAKASRGKSTPAASKNAAPSVKAAGKSLVIVESPAKARTVGQILGNKYVVAASQGHLRDLPKSAIGVDVDHDFEPSYVVMQDKRKLLNTLKKAGDEASQIYLATDPDREGEAISWHLLNAAKWDGRSEPPQRVVFHEITREAVEEAFRHPRDIDMQLVNAQQARRILDRLGWLPGQPACCGAGCSAACPPGGCSRRPCAWWSTASRRFRSSSRWNPGP